ncbi:hypothetical protein [Streptomyces sp. NPDC000880]
MPNDDAADEQQAQEPAPMPLDKVALVAALARLHDEQVGKLVRERMKSPTSLLVEAYEKSGQPGVVAKASGQVAGRYTVNTTKPRIVVDDEKLLDAYAEAHGGLQVVIQRDPVWEAALLKYAKKDPGTGLIVDTRNGEVVPGLKHVAGGDPTGSVTFTWADGDAGRKALLDAWQRGDFDDLLEEMPMLMPARPAQS